MVYSKIHRATITHANLNYVGSITIDKILLKASGLRAGQKVDIVNINNGERFSTYIIEGKKNSGDVKINGAAARKVQIGDKVIVIAYASYSKKELKVHKPKAVIVGDNNRILRTTTNLEDK